MKVHTCVCGKSCRGRAGLLNHGRACPVEQARSEAVVAAYEAGRHSEAHADGARAVEAALAERATL